MTKHHGDSDEMAAFSEEITALIGKHIKDGDLCLTCAIRTMTVNWLAALVANGRVQPEMLELTASRFASEALYILETQEFNVIQVDDAASLLDEFIKNKG